MTTKMTGWHTDPFGRHQLRYFSLDGRPTRLVSTAGKTSHDQVAGSPRWPVGAAEASPTPVAPHLPLRDSTAASSRALQRGWRSDPFGRHEARYFSLDGKPTRLVSDAGKTSHDAAAPGLSPLLLAAAATSYPAEHRGHQENQVAGQERAEPVVHEGFESYDQSARDPGEIEDGEGVEADPSPSDPLFLPEASGPAMSASDPEPPASMASESPTDADPENRKKVTIIGATVGAVALVTALALTIGPSGNGAPHQSTGTVDSTTATKSSLPLSSRGVTPTAAAAAPSATIPPTTAATATTLPTTPTTATPTTATSTTRAAATPATKTAPTTTTTRPTTTTTASSVKPGSSVPVTTSPPQTRAGAPTTTTQPAPTPPVTSFGNGTYEVGSQLVAQTYRAAGGTDCSWARLSSLGGAANDVIADGDPLGPPIVTVAPTDAAFESEGCGIWSPAPTSGPEATSMGDGTWGVGIDIVAGTYQATSTGSCYWARLSSFSGETDATITDGDAAPGPFTVTISPSDVGFLSSGCGEWTLVG
jgi:hypothetical protein